MFSGTIWTVPMGTISQYNQQFLFFTVPKSKIETFEADLDLWLWPFVGTWNINKFKIILKFCLVSSSMWSQSYKKKNKKYNNLHRCCSVWPNISLWKSQLWFLDEILKCITNLSWHNRSPPDIHVKRTNKVKIRGAIQTHQWCTLSIKFMQRFWPPLPHAHTHTHTHTHTLALP